MSIESLGRKKRAMSTPPARKAARTDAGPDPWAVLAPLGDKATRTATALAELAVHTSNLPETWSLQEAIAEAATHEILNAHHASWKNGIAHGKWLVAHECEANRALVEAKLCDLQARFDLLQERYEEAKAVISRSTLRDISNLV